MLSTALLTYILVFLSTLCSTLPSPALKSRDLCIWPSSWQTTSFSCEVVDDTVISGIEYTVSRFPEVPESSEYITYVNTVLHDVSMLYSSFLGDLSLAVSIWILEDMDPADESLLALTQTKLSHCYIRIETDKVDAKKPENLFKSTMAHEMYHCIQQLLRNPAGSDEERDLSKWWREGTAEFMGNYFYPDFNTENPQINYYEQTRAPYDLVNAYPAGVIFQYLSNIGWTPAQVHAWMLRQVYTGDANAELARIATDRDLVAAWPGFAASFADSRIAWKDGSLVKPFKFVPSTIFTVPEAPSSKQLISISPFRIDKYSTLFEADKVVSMVFTPDEPGDSKTILQYRQGSSGAWDTATPGDTIDLQNTGTSKCPTGPQWWDFILTSTNDPALNTKTNDGQSHATLTFSVTTSQRKRDDSCNPTDQAPGDLDQCLVGDWNLDIASMQAFMTKQMSTITAATVTNLVVSGSSTMNIDSTFHSTMAMSPLSISYDASADGFSFHSDITIDGNVDGTIVTGTQPSSFTWALGFTSSGNIHTVTHIPSLDIDLPIDIPFGSQYGSETQVDYVCSGNTLQMTGYVSGKYTWAYTWTKA